VRLVATKRIAAGAVLARDVVSGRPGEAPLLRAGTELTSRMRDALLRYGIHGVYVDDELGAGIEVVQAITEQTRREATDRLAEALSDISSLGGGALPAAAIAGLQEVAERIAADISSSDDAALALADLAGADAYTLQHSIDVTVVGLLVAKRHFADHGWIDPFGRRSFERVDERLARLGVGLLLHDIGKITIPAAVLNKPGKLSADEWELMRRHPVAGVELLKSDSISAAVKGVVRSHHERWDGSGYPDGRKGEEIFELARIAAVADVFDAVTSERPYRGAEAAFVGVDVIAGGAGTAFDPGIVETFRRVVAPYPPGSEIVLGDGRRGVVVSVDPDVLELPVVRVWAEADGADATPYELDLQEWPELAPDALLVAA
jgi:HD-GYP domain-containing protein (c-di-GMP phosphodiesterase class II)